MRITTYKAKMDNDYRNTILVREKSSNYTTLENLSEPKEVVNVMNDVFSLNLMAEEYCFLICVDSKNHPVGFFEISHGTINASLVSGRSIYSRALLLGSANILLIHNHPSGITTPSTEDIQITEKVYNAGLLLDVQLLDHIIIAGNDYYSFKENKLIIQ